MKSTQRTEDLCLSLVLLLSISSPAAGFHIRLNGSGSTWCSGRVEILYNGAWGTVCDDDWDLTDALVVCRESNCGIALSAPTKAYFGEGDGVIWFDDLDCIGMERTLNECNHRGLRQHNCKHDEDAGVICSKSISNPSIFISPVGEVFRGEDVNITCSIPPLVTEGLFILKKTMGSFDMYQPANTNCVTFIIPKVDFDDQGLYRCQYKKRVWNQYYLSPLSDPVSLSINVRMQQPIISLTSPNRELEWTSEYAEVIRGHSFVFTCSINSTFPEGRFFLISSDSNNTDTKPAVNQSASFYVPVAEYEHQGNYSCVYEATVSTWRFNSTESPPIQVFIKLSLVPLVSLVSVGVLLLFSVPAVVLICVFCRRRKNPKQSRALVHTQLAVRVGDCHKYEEDEEDYINVDPVDMKKSIKDEPGRVEDDNVYEEPDRCSAQLKKGSFRVDEEEDQTSDAEDAYDNVLQPFTEQTADTDGNDDGIYQNF